MSSDTPDWVRTACRRWGRQKRRIWSGKDWYIDSKGIKRYDIDGYAQSLLGRIREERDGAGQGELKQHWPEVFWGDGLDVQRATPGMPEHQLYAFHFKYVWDPEWGVTISKKAEILGVKRTEYYALEDRAETWIFSRLDHSGRPDAQLTDCVHEIIKQALQSERVHDIKSHTRQKYPLAELNLAALRRKKLSLVS